MPALHARHPIPIVRQNTVLLLPPAFSFVASPSSSPLFHPKPLYKPLSPLLLHHVIPSLFSFSVQPSTDPLIFSSHLCLYYIEMVHHHRLFFHQLRKGEPEPELPQHQKDSISMEPHRLPHLICTQYLGGGRPSKPTILRLFFLFSLIYFTLVFAPRLLLLAQNELLSESNVAPPPCSSVPNNTICCDRSALRTDVCFMRGDVRTHAPTNSILLHLPANSTTVSEERIRPYTRKWETSVMATIDELRLRSTAASPCDVRHDVPAVVFSTGGYTGNVYHEFNDGILPLYITAQHFHKQVVFVLLEYHDWWITKYADVLSRLSDYPPIDFTNDRRTHCFPEAIVGLRIHDELAIDPSQMGHNKTIVDFHHLLDDAYRPRIRGIEQEEAEKEKEKMTNTQKPKLVIVSRNGSRAIENEGEVARLAEEVGFRVEVLRPQRTTELARIYRALNGSDAMIGVHGAAMTHFLFMRPGSVFIQVVPLGTDWAAEAYYGGPAAKLGLRYMRYRVLPRESSLYREYGRDDPVLRDPESVNAKGWEMTKKVYLDGQKVRLDLGRFKKRLVRAHQHLVAKNGFKNWKKEKR